MNDTDMLFELIDQLTKIGLTKDGFRSKLPGGAFDDRGLNIRTREIGQAIADIASRGGVIGSNGVPIISPTDLMGVALRKVTYQMSHHPNYADLTYAWDGVAGWRP